MKRLFIVLIILGPYISYGRLEAQIYSTSSSIYHSYSTGGIVVAPSHVEFRSTSMYNSSVRPNIQQKCYSTAPMNVANGAIKTAASSIKGGVLTTPANPTTAPQRIQDRRNTMAPPTETPIGDGWDVTLLFFILCMGYIIYLKRKEKRVEIND